MKDLCGSSLISISKYYANVHGYASLVICLVGTVSNVLNIVIFGRKKTISPVNIILQGLSTVDLITLVAYLPYIWYMFLRASTDREVYSYSWSSFLFYQSYFLQALHCISLWLTIVLAIWRYIAIAYPLRKKSWCSMTLTRRIIIAEYIICPILCVPIMYSFTIQEQYVPVNQLGFIEEGANITKLYVMTMIQPADFWVNLNFIIYSVLLRLMPSILLTILSVKLIFALMKNRKNRRIIITTMKAFKKEKQVDLITSTMLMAVLILFLMNEIPQSVLILLVFIYGKKVLDDCYNQMGDILDLLALINSSLHFFLYYGMSRQYRSSFAQITFRRKPQRRITSDILLETKV